MSDIIKAYIPMQMNTCDILLRKARRTNTKNNWLAYKHKRNQVNNLVKSDKRKSYCKLL